MLREGRLTPAQAKAIDELTPRYGAPGGDVPLDFAALFGRHAPVHVEIGCGNGECILQLARDNPGNDYLGIEVHRPGVGSLMLRAAELGLGNLRILHRDAVEAIEQQIPLASIDCLYVFFADPWPKKRHHKRRLLQPAMLARLRDRLCRHGRLFIATDWQDYANHIEAALQEVCGLRDLATPARYAPRPGWRPRTRYERRGERLGHTVRDFMLGRV